LESLKIAAKVLLGSMANVKISISIPEAILRRVDDLSRSMKISRSELITRILVEALGAEAGGEPPKHPTVLWKLSKEGHYRLRSPRHRGRTIREKWVVEEDEEE
jgi:hypothetical protein